MDDAGEALRCWFAAAARDLPWRGPFPRDPYRVLVAEVMLQQTQVARVVESFERFLRRFPSVHDLAAAEQEEVVAEFGGLGYYRRARLLHAAARRVDAAGAWPRTFAELRRLPGIGPYTAAAVAAFAFGGVEPPVDGNVMRVAARILACDAPNGSRVLMQRARDVALGLAGRPPLPESWEAIMELGATLCTPAQPQCLLCPVYSACAAARSGTPEQYPGARTGRSPEHQVWLAAWVERTDGIVLLQHRDNGILRGLWLPPMTELDSAASPSGDQVFALLPFPGHGLTPEPMPEIRHSITYRRIRLTPYRVQVPPNQETRLPPGWRWERPETLLGRTSSLLSKLHRACTAGENP